MTAITFRVQQGLSSKLAPVANRVIEFLQGLRVSSGAAPQPMFLDPQALWDMGVTPEEVERKLRQPAWRHTGRLL